DADLAAGGVMTEAVSPASTQRRPGYYAIAAAKFLFCAIVLAFVITALVKQFREVQWSQVHLRAVPAVAAIVFLLGVSLMQLVARWTLLNAYGYRLGWRIKIPAAWVPQLGKFVPGGGARVEGM